MKTAIYARVSTANNGQDPRLQTRELQEYCQRRGGTVYTEYVDVGISGTKEKRPELDRLVIDAQRRRFDAVVVWKFDASRVPFRICFALSKTSRRWASSSSASQKAWIPARRPGRWFLLCSVP